jgi:hypothetical protein
MDEQLEEAAETHARDLAAANERNADLERALALARSSEADCGKKATELRQEFAAYVTGVEHTLRTQISSLKPLTAQARTALGIPEESRERGRAERMRPPPPSSREQPTINAQVTSSPLKRGWATDATDTEKSKKQRPEDEEEEPNDREQAAKPTASSSGHLAEASLEATLAHSRETEGTEPNTEARQEVIEQMSTSFPG